MTRHSLARDADAPGAARALLDNLVGEEIGWLAGDAALVVSELVTNSVVHSDAANGYPIELGVECNDRELRVEVCDYGSAKAQQSVRVRPSPTGIGGMGLMIVDILADAWGVKGEGQTCVWACFERPARKRRSPSPPG
jgi:anti-sigma regulatory factor (Ser/Thr protein kinase)